MIEVNKQELFRKTNFNFVMDYMAEKRVWKL